MLPLTRNNYSLHIPKEWRLDTTHDLVLEEYGGENEKGRKAYGFMISMDVSGEMNLKEKIVGQSIIGRNEFIEKILEQHLKKDADKREQPSFRQLHGLKAKEEIIEAVTDKLNESNRKETVTMKDLTPFTEKISAILTEDYLGRRARRAKKADFRKILDKVPDRKPLRGDEL